MSRDDYRPSEAQVRHHYQCGSCHQEIEVESYYAAPTICHCGGEMWFAGESYPADSREWDEQRDPDGEWRPRRW